MIKFISIFMDTIYKDKMDPYPLTSWLTKVISLGFSFFTCKRGVWATLISTNSFDFMLSVHTHMHLEAHLKTWNPLCEVLIMSPWLLHCKILVPGSQSVCPKICNSSHLSNCLPYLGGCCLYIVPHPYCPGIYKQWRGYAKHWFALGSSCSPRRAFESVFLSSVGRWN